MIVNIAVEGTTDEPIAKKVVETSGLVPGPVYIQRGKGQLDRKVRQYNIAAQRGPWFVLRDLDTDGCVVDVRDRLLPLPAPKMRFRLAVRKAESWLLADANAFAAFLGVMPTAIPLDPDALPDPKAMVVRLASRSRKRDIREGITPPLGSSVRVGPGYTALITEFVGRAWSPSRGAERSDSLRRCLAALRSLDAVH